MTKPVRIQLSRRKGFKLQDASRAVNGLVAVSVARPGRWGNPYRVVEELRCEGIIMPAINQAQAVELHRQNITTMMTNFPSVRKELHRDLCGVNLACWCALDEPCHADTLLELANQP
jgi:hypothetical protein